MTEKRFRYYVNPFREATPSFPTDALTKDSLDDIRHFHESLPEYSPTPLVRLDNLASCLGVGNILIKDEAHRFGINSFKGLGSAACLIQIQPSARPSLPLRKVIMAAELPGWLEDSDLRQ